MAKVKKPSNNEEVLRMELDKAQEMLAEQRHVAKMRNGEGDTTRCKPSRLQLTFNALATSSAVVLLLLGAAYYDKTPAYAVHDCLLDDNYRPVVIVGTQRADLFGFDNGVYTISPASINFQDSRIFNATIIVGAEKDDKKVPANVVERSYYKIPCKLKR